MSLASLLASRDRAGRSVDAAGQRALRALAAMPGWAQALVVYALARTFSALVTLAVARWEPANLWTPASPSYAQFTGDLWDSSWYAKIADHGYPLPLARGSDGVVAQSEWAFFPAYPLLVRAVMAATGGRWDVVAPTTSLALGALAAVALQRVFSRAAGASAALGGVLLVATFPSSPVLQYAYTESLALFALSWALAMLVERRYLWCGLAVVLLGASRAVALPFALVVVAHGIGRWRAGRAEMRRRDRFEPRALAAVVALALLSVAAGVAWPLAVGQATGVAHAYTQVQAAWRSGSVQWFLPWLHESQSLLGPIAGPAVLVASALGLLWCCTGPRARALGPELPAWSLAYAAYLLAVVDPWTSVFRFLLLEAPLGLLVATSARSRAHLAAWTVASLALQVVWIAWIWRFSPPSDYPP